MNVKVKLLMDEFGIKAYVFYKPGMISTPMFILTESDAQEFLTSFLDAFKKPEYTVREISK